MIALYSGHTRHRRFTPKSHEFSFNLEMVLFDADQLGGAKPPSLQAAKRQRVDRADLFDGDTTTTLGDAVRAFVNQQNDTTCTGPVRTLCLARANGYVFNPLTVHWVMTPEGTQVESMVLEVTNTPWNERHFYAVTSPARFAKELHVSPFGRMDETYGFSCSGPEAAIWLRLENFDASGTRIFCADLSLRRDTRNTLPFLTQRVWLAIHRQALRLWLKKVPIQPHPKRQ
ncbi:MAG: DUF1365 domain-containing protein [Acidimicrobiales bacterium]